MANGEYTVTWSAIAGWSPPNRNPATQSLIDGDDLLFTGIYAAELLTAGSIVIDPDPDSVNAPWRLTGVQGYAREGTGDATLFAMPDGDYTLTWLPIFGWAPPADAAAETQTLSDDVAITFTGIYTSTANETGTILVDPDPDIVNAPWRIVGPATAILDGNGDTTLIGVPFGDYSVTWLTSDEYVAPSPNSVAVTLSSSEPLTIRGAYAATEHRCAASPSEMVDAYVAAMTGTDIVAYRKLLAQNFKFLMRPQSAQGIGWPRDYLTRDEDLDFSEHLFDTVSESILYLDGQGDWEEESDSHAYFPDLLGREYNFHGEYFDPNTGTRYIVDGPVAFYVSSYDITVGDEVITCWLLAGQHDRTLAKATVTLPFSCLKTWFR